jgi:hypothetical protein
MNAGEQTAFTELIAGLLCELLDPALPLSPQPASNAQIMAKNAVAAKRRVPAIGENNPARKSRSELSASVPIARPPESVGDSLEFYTF